MILPSRVFTTFALMLFPFQKVYMSLPDDLIIPPVVIPL